MAITYAHTKMRITKLLDTPSTRNTRTASALVNRAMIWIRLLVFLVVLSAASAWGVETAVTSPPIVILEIAPRDLGTAHSEGDLLLAASSGGKEIYIFDSEAGEVETFLESGEAWGDPINLAGGVSSPLHGVSRFDIRDGIMAFSAGEGVYVYSDEGQLKHQRRIFRPGDISVLSSGSWAVSLINLPHPAVPGRFLARGEFGEEVPRIVFLDRDFELAEAGLFMEDEKVSGSAAAGRTLRLAWGGDRLYAAELANYRVSEFDRNLNLTASFSEPELFFEEGREDSVDPADSGTTKLEESFDQKEKSLGRDLARAPKAARPGKRTVQAFHYTPVIRDIAWDQDSDRLILLIDRGIASAQHAIDMLDPLTGRVRRVLCELPEEIGQGLTLTQIAAGKRYVWLRGYDGTTPTFRVSKLDLTEGSELMLPEVSFAAEDE